MEERNSRSPSDANGVPSAQKEKSHVGRTNGQGLSDQINCHGYTVAFSVPWIVRGAKTGQDAINIAVSEVGKCISLASNEIRNVDISVQRIGCTNCSSESDALLLVSETALVGLFLEVEIKGPDPATAETIARRTIGPHLHDTPLTSVDVSLTR